MTKPLLTSFAVLLVFAVAVAPAVAQSSPPAPSAAAAPSPPGDADTRWAPWLGCWRGEGDAAGVGPRVCVTAAERGVTLHTIVGGQRVSQEPRVADGAARPVAEADCRGTEQVRWSADGRRAFRTANASCGAEAPRTLASVSFLVPGPVWVDVQTVAHAGATNVRVTRSVRSANQRLPDGSTAPPASRTGDPLLTRGWTTDDVLELSAVLPPDGVQAAIGEGPVAFHLNAASLSRMADAGVSEGVIDLMVAMTYPERFVVNRASGSGWSVGSLDAGGGGDPFFSQILGSAALYDCYSPYGWAASGYWAGCSSYDPYLYSSRPGYYNGYYNGYYGAFGSPWIATQGASSPAITAAEGTGRVVNGRGYTQVRPAETTSAGAHGSDRFDGGSVGTSGTSSSGGATSSGYSGGGGGGGGDGGRSAVPRPPGL